MGRKNDTIEVDGTKYALTQYSGTKGTELFVEVIKALGEPLSFIVKGAQGGSESQYNIEMFGQALRSFASNAEPKEFVGLMKRILEGVIVIREDGNGPVNFDVDFQGRIGHLLRVVFHVLKFQYEDFLDAVVGLTPGAPATAAKFKAL